MIKAEFLEYLGKKLQILNRQERDDILNEYAQHIELKMKSGLSEEEAIHDFGNLEELAAEILDAYNVNPDYDKKALRLNGSKIGEKIGRNMTGAGHRIGGFCSRCFRAVKDKAAGAAEFRFGELTKKILVILAVYVLLTVLDFILADGLYGLLDYPFDGIAAFLAVVLFHFWYIYRSLSMLHTYVVTHREGGEEHMEAQKLKEEHTGKMRTGIKQLLKLPEHSIKEIHNGDRKVYRLLERLWKALKRTVLVVCKTVVACFLIPVIFFLLFLVLALGTLLVLTALGYPLAGVTVMAVGGLLSCLSFIWLCGIFLMGKRGKRDET